MTDARIVYCLTRDRELAAAIDDAMVDAIAFFYNDAARLNQAVTLRQPDVVVVDTGAIRPEYGDAGLGQVFDFLRRRAAAARLSVRPGPGAEVLVAAEAGIGVTLLPAERGACVRDVVGLARG
ncbi:MAG TPA: hypothetical protein VGA26_02470 [Candidatus Limnocylindria bacterium]